MTTNAFHIKEKKAVCVGPAVVSLRNRGEASPDSSENRGTFRAGHGVVVLLNIKANENISRVIVSSRCEEIIGFTNVTF